MERICVGQNNSIWYSNLFDINEVKLDNDFSDFLMNVLVVFHLIILILLMMRF